MYGYAVTFMWIKAIYDATPCHKNISVSQPYEDGMAEAPREVLIRVVW